ncbi:peptide chain release factor-like protein [Tenacibaculum sp. C7A-26P2]|uniref:peptide chain release factor-like protein n=1 Tax=Tenacibaculum sp. C7A-26P2 TaxID=3447504 RepID=UPI003F8443EF
MNKTIIFRELNFKAVRSSGNGGQHINKVASKVVLSFFIQTSQGLSKSEKELILKNLSNKISSNGVLRMSSQSTRSQHHNKELVIIRFFSLLAQATIISKPRKKSLYNKKLHQKRLKAKKHLSEKKDSRKKLRF